MCLKYFFFKAEKLYVLLYLNFMLISLIDAITTFLKYLKIILKDRKIDNFCEKIKNKFTKIIIAE